VFRTARATLSACTADPPLNSDVCPTLIAEPEGTSSLGRGRPPTPLPFSTPHSPCWRWLPARLDIGLQLPAGAYPAGRRRTSGAPVHVSTVRAMKRHTFWRPPPVDLNLHLVFLWCTSQATDREVRGRRWYLGLQRDLLRFEDFCLIYPGFPSRNQGVAVFFPCIPVLPSLGVIAPASVAVFLMGTSLQT